MRNIIIGLCFMGTVLAGRAFAEPVLQLYIEGSTYDAGTESWTIPLTSDPIRLWAIGYVGGQKAHGTIYEVHLILAFPDPGASPISISITPSTTGGLGGFVDPSTPGMPTLLRIVTDGSRPLMADGASLPGHGEYGPGIFWAEFDLGDFTLQDSPVADFIDSFPGPAKPGKGQIDVYSILISGVSSVHFDLMGGVRNSPIQGLFAPFSHDAVGGDGPPPVPEPATLLLLAAAGGALGLRRRLRRTP